MEKIKNEIITSLEIAQLLKKQHSDVLRDLRDETNKLGQELAEKDFTLLIYKDANNESLPLYKLTKEGALIFAQRYKEHTKKTLVDKINDLTKEETISKTETVQDKVDNEVKSEEINSKIAEDTNKEEITSLETAEKYYNLINDLTKDKEESISRDQRERKLSSKIEKVDIKLQQMELNIKLLNLKKEKILEKYKLSGDKSLLEIEQEQEELKLIHEKYLLQMQIEKYNF